jgi:hypothetical protein
MAHECLHLFFFQLEAPSRILGQESALRLRQTETILLVCPRADDVYLGHARTLSRRMLSECDDPVAAV